MGCRAGLDGCGKSCLHRDSIPGPSSSKQVVIPTTLSWPVEYEVYYCKIPNTLDDVLKTQHVPVGRNTCVIVESDCEVA